MQHRVRRFGVSTLSVATLALGCSSSGAVDGSASGLDAGATPLADASADAVNDATSDAVAEAADADDASDAGATTLSFPQLVHGAARVNRLAITTVPIAVDVQGTQPDAVSVTVGSLPAAAATLGPHGWVAHVDVSSLADGDAALGATATRAGASVATASGTLVLASDSAQFTQFATAGQAYSDQLVHDTARDRLSYTWVQGAPAHTLSLAYLDGAFRRIGTGPDTSLGAPGDAPLQSAIGFGKDALGVAYRIAKPGDSHWSIRMRVTDLQGGEIEPAKDLTAGQSAFAELGAAADPGGFSAAWLHITDGTSPVELRFARYDAQAKTWKSTLTLDSDQPEAANGAGVQALEPLADIRVACDAKTCMVAYVRDMYEPLVALNVPKVMIAIVDLGTNSLRGTPFAVQPADWDSELYGHDITALSDGSFALVYQGVDTAAAVTPKAPCDQSIERDLLFGQSLNGEGKPKGAPRPIFDFQGSRQYPRIAEHPDGLGLVWEDQREECGNNGHIRMSANVTPKDFQGLIDPYAPAPGSIGLPPEYPTVAVAGRNVLYCWSDNRHGVGLVDPKTELYCETVWRE